MTPPASPTTSTRCRSTSSPAPRPTRSGSTPPSCRGAGSRTSLRALKTSPGWDIVTTGSITLVHALIAAGLVDEYRLFVYLVVLGRGARLFADATEVPRLRLVETRPFRSGVVLLRYRPDPPGRLPRSQATAPHGTWLYMAAGDECPAISHAKRGK